MEVDDGQTGAKDAKYFTEVEKVDGNSAVRRAAKSDPGDAAVGNFDAVPLLERQLSAPV